MCTMRVMVNGKEEEREIDHYEREERTMMQTSIPVLRKGEIVEKGIDGITHIFQGAVDE